MECCCIDELIVCFIGIVFFFERFVVGVDYLLCVFDFFGGWCKDVVGQFDLVWVNVLFVDGVQISCLSCFGLVVFWVFEVVERVVDCIDFGGVVGGEYVYVVCVLQVIVIVEVVVEFVIEVYVYVFGEVVEVEDQCFQFG